MAAPWLELTLTESIDALCFCRCAESRVEVEEYDQYLVCVTCGTWRDQRTGVIARPRLVTNV